MEENVDEYDTLRIRWIVLCVLDFHDIGKKVFLLQLTDFNILGKIYPKMEK